MTSPLVHAVLFATGALLLLVLSFRTARTWLRLGMRIVAAWLVAIALLSAIIPLVVQTPGYRKDHME